MACWGHKHLHLAKSNTISSFSTYSNSQQQVTLLILLFMKHCFPCFWPAHCLLPGWLCPLSSTGFSSFWLSMLAYGSISAFLFSLCDLIQPHGFKGSPNANDSQILSSNPTFPFLRISNLACPKWDSKISPLNPPVFQSSSTQQHGTTIHQGVQTKILDYFLTLLSFRLPIHSISKSSQVYPKSGLSLPPYLLPP